MKRTKSKPWLLNKTESAAFFQISVQAISNWDIEPVEKKGNQVFYDLRDLVAYKHAYEPDDEQKLDLSQERAKLTIEQTRTAKLQRRVLEGDLLEIQSVIVAFQQMSISVRSKLLSMPTKMAQELTNIETPVEIQEKLKKEIYELLDELSSEQFANQLNVESERFLRRLESIQASDRTNS